MKLLFLLSLAGIVWMIPCAIIAACCGSFLWTMASVETAILCAFVASREYDAIQDFDTSDETRL